MFYSLFSEISILLKSLLVGAVSGLVVSAYRFALDSSTELRTRGLGSAMAYGPHTAVLLFGLLLAAALYVGRLIDRHPGIQGSGVPHVKKALFGCFGRDGIGEAVRKFFAGAVCVGCGLSLGRAGPSLQFGAYVGTGVASGARADGKDVRLLLSVGAASGLAAAFGSPFSGLLFVFEEFRQGFSFRLLLHAAAGVAAAEAVVAGLFGSLPLLGFLPSGDVPVPAYIQLLGLGLLSGFFGLLFNWSMLKSLDFQAKLIPEIRFRPLPAFLASGAFVFLFPVITGGGAEMLRDGILEGSGPRMLLIILVLKLLFTALSYGSGVPGGLFFPLLSLGALLGSCYGKFLPSLGLQTQVSAGTFAVLGMAAVFSSIVKAPVTATALAVELSGDFSLLVPSFIAAFAAFAVVSGLRIKPLYEAFLDRILSRGTDSTPFLPRNSNGSVPVFIAVQAGSPWIGRAAAELRLPEGVNFASLRRKKESQPADVKLEPGDCVEFHVERARRNQFLESAAGRPG